MKKNYILLFLSALIILGLVYFYPYSTSKTPKILSKNDLHSQITTHINDLNLPYPLPSLQILLFKKEQKIELWTTTDTSKNFIQSYDFTIVNTTAGVRLFNNESTFPEGEYKLFWNTDTLIQLSFPNAFDTLKAKSDNRPKLNANLVFSKNTGISRVTLSPNDLNEIQLYVKDTDIQKVILYSFPSDNRNGLPFDGCKACPHWIVELYTRLDLILAGFHQVAFLK